jgi:hypothetical protein
MYLYCATFARHENGYSPEYMYTYTCSVSCDTIHFNFFRSKLLLVLYLGSTVKFETTLKGCPLFTTSLLNIFEISFEKTNFYFSFSFENKIDYDIQVFYKNNAFLLLVFKPVINTI